MKFKYQNKTYHFPASLRDITLRKRIEFDKLYAKDIETMRNDVYRKDENGMDIPPVEMDEILFNVSVALRNFAFFTGIPLEEVEQNIAVEDVLNVYHSCFKQLHEQQDDIKIEKEYVWNDEVWTLEQPKLTYESKITFNELVVSKQIVKQMHDVGSGNWEAMVYIASIFLKRKDEVFDESWIAPDSERLQMMYDLPMDIALAVGFFLQVSMSVFTRTSQYSEEVGAEKDRQ